MVKVKIKSLGGLNSTLLKGQHLLTVGGVVELPDEIAAYLPATAEYELLSGIVPPIVVRPHQLKAEALKVAKAVFGGFAKEPSLALADIPQLPKEAAAALLGKDAMAAVKAGTLDKVAAPAAITAKLLGMDDVAAELAKRATPKEK